MKKERLTTFIDAVLAIVMTILVLELEKPKQITPQGFWNLRENFFAYTLSFFWLGAMWVNLHNEWYPLARINRKTIWATLLMLFFASLFPYATSIVSSNFNNRTAQVFYGIVVLLITFSNIFMYRVLQNANAQDATFINHMRHRLDWAWYDVAIKLIGFVISLTVYPPAMIYSVLITLVVLVIPNQLKPAK